MRYQLSLFLSISVWIFSIPALSQVVSQSDNNPNEVSIAVNHQNEGQILVASNIANLYLSADSGKSWTEKKLESSLGVAGDPTLFCDEQGIFYYAHLSKTPGKERPDYFDRMVVQRSLDGGITWNDGVGVGFNGGKMQDKEWLAGDVLSGSPFYGNVYLSWTEFDVYKSADTSHRSRIRFAVSDDKGRTFSEPVVVSDETGDCMDGDNTLEGATVACGPNGEIYITWAGNGKLWFDVSYDGGKTFGEDRLLAILHDGWTLDVSGIYRSNGMPFIACDVRRGDLWITYADRDSGQNSRVWVMHTKDGNNWNVHLASSYDFGDAFFPNLVLNPQTGQAAVVFYQEVNEKKLRVDMVVYESNDFASPKVTRVSLPFSKPGKNIFFGDYIDIDYFGEGFIASWTSFEKTRLFGKQRLLVRAKKVF